MEKAIERFTDYFMRYTADVPADEVEMHVGFNRLCKCMPEVTFDEKTGWRTFVHKSLHTNTELKGEQ